MNDAFNVDELAQEIRRVDGDHSLGAGALAEALMPWIADRASHSASGKEVLEKAAKALHRRAQSVYRRDHDHFPIRNDWEGLDEMLRQGWRDMAEAALSALPTSPSDVARLEGDVARWRPMSEAPTDGKHCILSVPSGPFFVSVQGFFYGGKWVHVLDTDAQPVAWMPNVLLPDEFLPKRLRARASQDEGDGR